MTAEHSENRLSEAAANVVENVACRVAERLGGRITANHLLPHLPLSLDLIRSCLDAMADGASVSSETADNILWYEFAAYRDAGPKDGPPEPASCVACDKDLASRGRELLCAECAGLLRKELNRLAARTAWPARAVYEHALVYQAARRPGPAHPEAIAGASPYTLRSTRRKLDRLAADHAARQALDADAGVVTYAFPEIRYPRDRFRTNMEVIRSYPASRMEEVQTKFVKICFTLGFLFLALLGAAFFGVPFPLLVALFFVTGPVVSWWIWRHRSRPERD